MDLLIFSQRLKNARIMKHFTLDQLCESINKLVTKAAISKYENGKMEPSDEVKQALARALGVDISYFERPFDNNIEQCEIDFRKKSSMPKSEENALTLTAREKVERYIEIRKILRGNNVVSVVKRSPKEKRFAVREIRLLMILGNFLGSVCIPRIGQSQPLTPWRNPSLQRRQCDGAPCQDKKNQILN